MDNPTSESFSKNAIETPEKNEDVSNLLREVGAQESWKSPALDSNELHPRLSASESDESSLPELAGYDKSGKVEKNECHFEKSLQKEKYGLVECHSDNVKEDIAIEKDDHYSTGLETHEIIMY